MSLAEERNDLQIVLIAGTVCNADTHKDNWTP